MTDTEKKFPQDINKFSDKELKEKMKEYLIFMSGLLTDERRISYLQLAHDELQNRQSKRYMMGFFAMAGFYLMNSRNAVCVAFSSSRVSSRWEDKQLPLIQQLIDETKAQTEKQISIAETHLATIKEMEQTISKDRQQISISINKIKRNVEMLKKNSEKPEEPVEDVIIDSDDSLQTTGPTQ